MLYRTIRIVVLAACILPFGGKHLHANAVGSASNTAGVDTLHLSIPQNYLVFADSVVIVSQFITDSLNGLPSSIQSFSEYINYNSNILEFVDVRNGANTPLADWSLNKSVTTPGILFVKAISDGVALKTPGEILQLVFHVVSQAPTYSSSTFIDSLVSFGNDPKDPVIIADTGFLRVIDACSPIMGSNVTPPSNIMQCSPNPANGSANISYFVAPGRYALLQHVQLQLYNSAGSLVRTIRDADAAPGWHRLVINVSGLSEGIYSLEFQAGPTSLIQRLLILH